MNTLTKLVHMVERAEKNKVETVETPLLLLRVIAIQLYIFGERVEADPEARVEGAQTTARPTGDACQTCGGMLVQTGKCRTCQSCGNSDGGCS